jgi:hypothetical protein
MNNASKFPYTTYPDETSREEKERVSGRVCVVDDVCVYMWVLPLLRRSDTAMRAALASLLPGCHPSFGFPNNKNEKEFFLTL